MEIANVEAEAKEHNYHETKCNYMFTALTLWLLGYYINSKSNILTWSACRWHFLIKGVNQADSINFAHPLPPR